MLGKSLNATKWVALLLLTIGVALVNYKPGGSKSDDTEGKSIFIGTVYVK